MKMTKELTRERTCVGEGCTAAFYEPIITAPPNKGTLVSWVLFVALCMSYIMLHCVVLCIVQCFHMHEPRWFHFNRC
jgi:hypothetical protein